MVKVTPLHVIVAFSVLVVGYNVYFTIDHYVNHFLIVQHNMEVRLQRLESMVPSSMTGLNLLPSEEMAGRTKALRGSAATAASTVTAASSPPPIPATIMGGAPSAHNPCRYDKGVEYWGDLMQDGTGNLQTSPEACCRSCQLLAPRPDGKDCNTWVWCGKQGGCGVAPYHQPQYSCWLKWLPHPELASFGVSEARRGGGASDWTSGSLAEPITFSQPEPGPHRAYHVLVSSDASTYNRWQLRIMYYWYQKQRAADTSGQMGGFTRLLHDHPDELMGEIPTVVVDRVKNDYGFVVLNRPWAFQQWTMKYIETIPEKYILMAEPDHIFMKPLPNLMVGDQPASFPFFYITPAEHPDLVRTLLSKHLNPPLSNKEVAQLDPVGNSPTLLSKYDLRTVAPVWVNMSFEIKLNKQSDAEWGWMQEMYAYSFAAHLVGLKHALRPDFQCQPPFDYDCDLHYILHYTYGDFMRANGTLTEELKADVAWAFNKRKFRFHISKNIPQPPEGSPPSVSKLVGLLNEATSSLPNWPDAPGI
eukprot:jgi/Mesvir1/5321/Mv25551-RA.1